MNNNLNFHVLQGGYIGNPSSKQKELEINEEGILLPTGFDLENESGVLQANSTNQNVQDSDILLPPGIVIID